MTDTFNDTPLDTPETAENELLETEPLINTDATEISAADTATTPTLEENFAAELAAEPTQESTEAPLKEPAEAPAEDLTEPASASILEIVADTAGTIIDTVATVDEIFTDASNVIAANPDKVEEIVMDAGDALATTAALATGAQPFPHISRLVGIFTRLFSNIFHLFQKVKEE